MRSNTETDPALYRAALEEDLREWGARFEEDPSKTLAYVPGKPNASALRVVLEAAQVTIEAQTDAGAWEAESPISYEDAWAMFAKGRVRGAQRILAGLGLWVVVGAAVVVEMWLKGGPAGLHAFLGIGPLLGGGYLWFRQIPSREPYPGLFIAAGMFGLSLLIRYSHHPVWVPLTLGASSVCLAAWGFMHCGGPEMSRYLTSHLSRDPRRTASSTH